MNKEYCEWNPVDDIPASGGIGCINTAEYSVGSKVENNYHLCFHCAQLPRFRRFKKRNLKTGQIADEFQKSPSAVEMATCPACGMMHPAEFVPCDKR